ncbi:T9SS type A sorting domain-containing protein [Bacteroidota bacterium]
MNWWPGPACRFILLRTSEDDATLIEVYDMHGRRVKKLAEEVIRPGSYSRRLDVADMVPGLYVVRISSKSGSVSRKMTVMR